MSQYSNLQCFVDGIENEAADGVWGYLLPIAPSAQAPMALHYMISGVGVKVSNRHFLLFREIRNGRTVALLEDLSTNGTYINRQLVGKNGCRELRDGDEISCVQHASFLFRYPRTLVAHTNFHGSYELQERLGSGTYATVHVAVEKHTGSRYAVKCFAKRATDGQSFVDYSLRRELATLTSLRHPNIMCIRDAFDEPDGVFLVLELAQGDLYSVISRQGRLDEGYARHILDQLLQATTYLHDRNIAHRDIKLENILLTDNGQTAKLADFGLAKILGEQSFTATLCGTLLYVAPEVIAGGGEPGYTRAVDVWSLGVVLYTCLSGQLPFSDDRFDVEDFPFRLADQIREGLVSYAAAAWETIDDTPLDLIDRMLTVDFRSRISAAECLQHPWLTGILPQPSEEGQGLYQALKAMDISKQEITRRAALLRSRTFDLARAQLSSQSQAQSQRTAAHA
ncbi:hypothetical protein KEM52_002253 [Ascosphaera acerosa]|nr:hypothetical protein KEM52_002253 [Ascosphaera acerosa]